MRPWGVPHWSKTCTNTLSLLALCASFCRNRGMFKATVTLRNCIKKNQETKCDELDGSSE